MDASLLRWILLFIGLVVILGVYLAGLHQVRMRKQAQIDTFSRGDEPFDLLDADLRRELEGLENVVQDEPQLESEVPKVSPAIEDPRNSSPVPPVAGPPNEATAAQHKSSESPSRTVEVPRSLRHSSQPVASSRQAQDLVLFYLKPVSGEPVRQRFLIQILQNCGLEFGERQMFHLLDCGQILFSVAALTDDGVLDPGMPANQMLPGVVCYMRVGQQRYPQRSFEKMLQAIDLLVRGLEFKVYKADWRLLTVDDVKRIREQLHRLQPGHDAESQRGV